MNKPELLMPAGNIEKLKYGIKYGADAVYLGVVDFSLRAMRKGELITLDNLKLAIDTAHQMGAKAYLTGREISPFFISFIYEKINCLGI